MEGARAARSFSPRAEKLAARSQNGSGGFWKVGVPFQVTV
jgi:hypothetical protein